MIQSYFASVGMAAILMLLIVVDLRGAGRALHRRMQEGGDA